MPNILQIKAKAKELHQALTSSKTAKSIFPVIDTDAISLRLGADPDHKLIELITSEHTTLQMKVRRKHGYTDPVELGASFKRDIRKSSTMRKIHFYLLLAVRNQCHSDAVDKGISFSFEKKAFLNFFGADLSDFRHAWNQQDYGLALIYWVNLSPTDRLNFFRELATSKPDVIEKHHGALAFMIPLLTSMPDLDINQCMGPMDSGMLDLSVNNPALFDALIRLDYIEADIHHDNTPLLLWLFEHRGDPSKPSFSGDDFERIIRIHPKLKQYLKNQMTREQWQSLDPTNGVLTFAGFLMINLRRSVFDDFRFGPDQIKNISLSTPATKSGLSIVALLHFHGLDSAIKSHFDVDIAKNRVFQREAVFKINKTAFTEYAVDLFIEQVSRQLGIELQDDRARIKDRYSKDFSFPLSCLGYEEIRISKICDFARDYQERVFAELKGLLKDYSADNLQAVKVQDTFSASTLKSEHDAVVAMCVGLLFPGFDVTSHAAKTYNNKLLIVLMYETAPKYFRLLCQHRMFNPYQKLNANGDTLVSLLVKAGEIDVLRKVKGYDAGKACFNNHNPLQYAARHVSMRVVCELWETNKVNEILIDSSVGTIELSGWLKKTYSNEETLNVKSQNGITMPFMRLIQLICVCLDFNSSHELIQLFDFEILDIMYLPDGDFSQFFINNSDVTSAQQNQLVGEILEAAVEALHSEFPNKPATGSYCSSFYSESSDPKFIDNKTHGWPLIDALEKICIRIDEAKESGTVCQHNFLHEAVSIVNAHIGPGLLYTRAIPAAGDAEPVRSRFATELAKMMLQQNFLIQFDFPSSETKDFSSFVTDVSQKFEKFADISYWCKRNAKDYSPETQSWVSSLTSGWSGK